jgi:class 3 adenylate cyclase/predicted ATPase/Flp pilus assembly protein TadD
MTSHRAPPLGRLTVVFTDLEDSSRMTKGLGDQIYHNKIHEPHCQRIRAAIAAHRGYEIKTIGDSFHIVFKLADDALACVVAIQKSLAQPAITATDDTGTEWKVKVRIGAHTADRELVPHEENGRFDYTGTDVNFAARVESLGAGGQVLVSASTYRAAGSRESYRWQEWPDRRIKSFDQPETVWELLWDDQSRGEPGARWLPRWFMGERNRYIPRPALQDTILRMFAVRQADGVLPRLITLHAEGGMGKTRLALACAIQAAGNFRDGIYFIRLDDRPKSKEALAEAIGAPLGRISEAALPDRLLAALHDADMLLVLDNYESVDCDAVAAYVAALLLETRGLRLLVTGREAVKLSDVEQLLSLDEGMTEAEAEQLFVARALLKQHGWQPTDADRAVVKRIVHLCGRIPLAVEFAAAWTYWRTLGEIADGIEATPLGEYMGERPRTHQTGETERHQSLDRCLAWSFNLLDRPTQERFAGLGVFADSFSSETVAAICAVPQARDLLDRLQDAALIRRAETGGRSCYTLHRFTRAYAAAKLPSLPEAPLIRQRFVAHFSKLITDHDDINDLCKLAILDAEWRNAATASAMAEELGNVEAVLLISEFLSGFLRLRGLWSESERLNLRAFKTARACKNKRAQGGALNNLGIVYEGQGRWADAMAAYLQGLSIFRELGDRLSEGKTLNNLGGVYNKQGLRTEAETAYQQDLAICREFGDRRGEGQTLNNLGIVYEAQGRWADAVAAYQQRLSICRQFDDRVGEGKTLNNLGIVYEAQRQWADAEAAYQQCLLIFRQFGDRVGEWRTLNNLGIVHEAQGRWADAEVAYQQSLTISRELSELVGEGQTLENLALLREAQGDVPGALELERLALRVFETTEDEAAKMKARALVAKWQGQA